MRFRDYKQSKNYYTDRSNCAENKGTKHNKIKTGKECRSKNSDIFKCKQAKKK